MTIRSVLGPAIFFYFWGMSYSIFSNKHLILKSLSKMMHLVAAEDS